MTSELITAQPAAPVEFMIEFLRANHLPADAKASPGEELGAKDDDYKDEGKSDDSSEDDEDDYIDYEEPAPARPSRAPSRGGSTTRPRRAPRGRRRRGRARAESKTLGAQRSIHRPAPKARPMTKRFSVAAPKVTVQASWEPPVFEKTPEQAKFLTSILSGIFFIKALTRKEIAILVAAMKEISYSDGDVVIKQGDEGDMFYIVESGSCNVEVEGMGKVNTIPCPSKEDPSVERRYVGELALLYDAPRNATVVADGAVGIWGLDRTTFKSILQESDNKKIMLYSKFIQSIAIFKDLTVTQINTLCNSLQGVDYSSGDTIIRQGEEGADFYIVESGEAECFKTNDGEEKLVMTLKAGDYFGELALVKDVPRQATVKAATPLSLVKIDRPTFKRMIGKLKLDRKYI